MNPHINILYSDSSYPLIERLLRVRGLSDPATQEQFLNPRFDNSWISPWLLSDMVKAIERIIVAINRQEKIIIFGDYDADGVSSSYLL
ncbi:MAG TPA: hypothetical protein PLW93_00375 [Candidatus Absconditabacterales bacterium]|nr:hypothetical protein [Candidatus Absconditabacterales bacterium]